MFVRPNFRRTLMPALMLALTALAFAAAIRAFAENIDPANNDSQFAWGENVGWINAEPLGESGPGMQVGGLGLTGYMYGENIGWINLSCENNNTCGTAQYGVTNDNAGNLAGYAWGENVGWISFSCANTNVCGATPYGVTIDPLTGVFSGFAWGENIGWISFADDVPVAYGVVTSDGDAVAQASDNCPFDNNDDQTNSDAANAASNRPGADAAGDPCDADDDGDGYSDELEASLGENPLSYCRTMRAEIDGDRLVSILDITIVASRFTQTVPPAPERYKQDADGNISILDLTFMANEFTKNVSTCT